MKLLVALLIILVWGLVLTTAANADDVDDVKAAVLAVDAAFNTGDVDAFAQYMHPEHSSFFPGELLLEGFSKDRLKALFDSGLKFDLETRHLNVKIYGNTAVATGYNVGTITLPDGTINQLTNRFTEVWIKQQGKWKRVHIHASPLTG